MKKRLLYPELLRIVSILSVIGIHVTSKGISNYALTSQTWMICTALNSMARWAVPVFFMISGMFALDPAKEFSTKKLIKRIGGLLLCIVVWGSFYSVVDDFLYDKVTLASIPRAILNVVRGTGGYHLWFLYTLVLLEIATPILRVFTKNASKKIAEYALLVWAVLSLGIGWVNALAEEILGYSFFQYSFPVLTGYTGYYLLGFYLSSYKDTLKWKNTTKIIGMLSIPVAAGLNLAASYLLHKPISAFGDSLGLFSCIAAIGIFLLAQDMKEPAPRCETAIRFLAKHVFGVYIVHVFWNFLLFRVLPLEYNFLGVYLSPFVWVLLVAAASWISAILLSKIPVVRKIVHL